MGFPSWLSGKESACLKENDGKIKLGCFAVVVQSLSHI